MLDTHARKHFDCLFDKLGYRLLAWKLRPNQVTILAFLIGICAGCVLYMGYQILASAFLWLSGLLDAVDGSMARQSGKASSQGAVLDIVGDRLVELGIFWALALRHPESLTAMLGLVSAVLVSMTVFLTTGMLAANTGKKSFYYQAGLMERTEGFIASTAMMLFQRFLVPLTWLYAGLILITIVQRVREASHLFGQDQNHG
ncbi:MAG: CDP-alcohol phosphatidyltransferase family protein [Candidatus Pelethousia sp.]|nr:CDP-alcohol phosphatidyltransferase family protein [Candidatus Pelethousia sp.]